MTDLWRLGAAALAAGYASGSVTPVDALDAVLARAEAVNPALNALIALDAPGARRAAEASARRWRDGAPLSPLDGVPVSVKDNLHVAGLPTRWGSRLMEGFVGPVDEAPVARLRASGAVILGKTNVPEFAMVGFTANDVHGVTRNPWDPALTPGGSSGGAAAAVAAGIGPLAVGTDGGGSIRRPASHCGLVGHKPSAGVVPRGGGLPAIFLDHEVVGGIGRRVADVAALTAVLAGGLLAAGPAPRRVLYVPRFGAHPVDPGIAEAVRRAAGDFAAMGLEVEEAASFDLAEEVNALWSGLSAAGLAWMMEEPACRAALGLGAAPDPSLLGPAARAALEAGRAMGAPALFRVLHAAAALRRALDAVFARHDMILTPATAALPWPAEETHPAAIAGEAVGPRGHAVFTAFANVAGLPGLALPCGWIGELPTGFQLVGPAGSDAALLALGEAYEARHPWADRWPLL